MDTRHDTVPEPVQTLRDHLAQGLVGHEHLIERLLIALLVGGHVLLEGPPGLAKTRAVKWLARGVEGTFARIQCTPDLMPSDVTGTAVYHPQDGRLDFSAGPVFHNLVLVDEINRAPPKVQSALLEAMAEGQVTAGMDRHELPRPFMVVATQNPIEHDGTFPLPEAQLDRFLLHVVLDMPDLETELKILDLVESEAVERPPPDPVMSLSVLQTAQEQMRAVHVSLELKDYVARLVLATRSGALADDIEHAVSPRGTLALATAARARAYLHGRSFALPEDVADLAAEALAHRMVLRWRAQADGRVARDVVADILAAVEPL